MIHVESEFDLICFCSILFYYHFMERLQIPFARDIIGSNQQRFKIKASVSNSF